MGKLFFLCFGAVFMFSQSSFAKTLACETPDLPAHLLVENKTSDDKNSISGRFILSINLEDPAKKPNTRITDSFKNLSLRADHWILMESYIHGVRLNKNGQSAEIDLFEREEPLSLHCEEV